MSSESQRTSRIVTMKVVAILSSAMIGPDSASLLVAQNLRE